MSKRKEDFKQAATDYADSPDETQRIIEQVGYEMGCEYGYTYAVDKIAEYLLSALKCELGYFAAGDFVKGVMKFMEKL